MGELDPYDYDLPRNLIAQSPLVSRADARLLVVDCRDHPLPTIISAICPTCSSPETAWS